MTDTPAVETPVDVQQMIRTILSELLPGALAPLLREFAELRLQEITVDHMRQIERRNSEARMVEQQAIERALTGVFTTQFSNFSNQMIKEMVGYAATVSGISEQIKQADKKRSQEMAAVRVDVEDVKHKLEDVSSDVSRINVDLYGDPQQKDKKSLYKMMQEVQEAQTLQTRQLLDLERKQAEVNDKVEETSAYIKQRKNLESMIAKGAKWLFATRSRAAISMVAIPAAVGLGGGLLTAVVEVVSKLLNP